MLIYSLAFVKISGVPLSETVFSTEPTIEMDFSIKDVYALRQAKEISMTMDNFNPDMINHVCILQELNA